MPARTLALCLIAALFVPPAALAQSAVPVLRADSALVDIRDGGVFLKGTWLADPSIELDTYTARRTTEARRVTFITDVDSLSFAVQPGGTYDFVILLNGKDSCRTRISALVQGYRRLAAGSPARPDTIPITIRGGKLHLEGAFNDSRTLDFIFDTGAEICALYPSGARKGAELQFDGTTSNTGTGGTTLRRTSSNNRLTIAGLQWNHELVMDIEKQADRADGIVGFLLFAGKVVELDFDRMVMVVHDSLPAHAAGYARTPMPYSGSLPAVEAVLVNGAQRAAGLFVLDTGASGTMNVNQAFAAAHGLHGAMRVLRASTSRGVGSAGIRNHVLLLPQLAIADFAFPNVPINVELPSNGNAAPPGGILCMELLQRFNTILDFQRNEAYFKPNKTFSAPFKARGSGPLRGLVPWLALPVAALLAGLALNRAMQRRNSVTAPPARP